MKIKSITFISIVFILLLAMGCSQVRTSGVLKGSVLAAFNGGNITAADVKNFKRYRKDNLTDKQALEILIERELLYKEALRQGKAVSIKEAQAEADKARTLLERYGTVKDRKAVQDEILKLKITEDKYWNEYYPKRLIKPMSTAKMKHEIKNEIYSDIIKSHGDWGQSEIKKQADEDYIKAINDLKARYDLRYNIK